MFTAGKSYANGTSDTDKGFVTSISNKISEFHHANTGNKIDPQHVEILIKNISSAPIIIGEANKNSEKKINAQVENMSKVIDKVAKQLSKNDIQVTFVLNSTSVPSCASKLADNNKNVLTSRSFKDGGAGDPFQIAIDKVAPPQAAKKNVPLWATKKPEGRATLQSKLLSEKSGDLKKMLGDEPDVKSNKSTPRPGG